MMTHEAIETAARERAADGLEGSPAVSDEELSVALRAAGASAEDVQRYLAADGRRTADMR